MVLITHDRARRVMCELHAISALIDVLPTVPAAVRVVLFDILRFDCVRHCQCQNVLWKLDREIHGAIVAEICGSTMLTTGESPLWGRISYRVSYGNTRYHM